ncbi:type II toxin-antitoxin system RelE/ParE family toxin [Patescibacteria group bacterium]
MKVIISPKAEKSIIKLPKHVQLLIEKNLRKLSKDPNSIKKKKLRDYKNIYRIRMGEYRLVFRVNKREIYVINIGHRGQIYEKLKRMFVFL